MAPVEPAPSQWEFPDVRRARSPDLIAVGADLAPGTVLTAYRAGLFPMPVSGKLGWWSPDPRAILPLDGLRVSRSLRASCRRFEVRLDFAFEATLDGCAHPSRPSGWITAEMRDAYVELHRLGWAHSVEAWSRATGQLAGGLYGLAIGGFFAGESMFFRERDASKVALVALVELLVAGGGGLLDVQWHTAHLGSLGAVEVPRRRYLELLAEALTRPLPPAFG